MWFLFNGSFQTVWSTAVISWLLRQEGQYSHRATHRFGSRRKVIVLFCFYRMTTLPPMLSFVVFEKCRHLQRLDKSPGERYKMCWVRTRMASRGWWSSTLSPAPPRVGWPSPSGLGGHDTQSSFHSISSASVDSINHGSKVLLKVSVLNMYMNMYWTYLSLTST